MKKGRPLFYSLGILISYISKCMLGHGDHCLIVCHKTLTIVHALDGKKMSIGDILLQRYDNLSFYGRRCIYMFSIAVINFQSDFQYLSKCQINLGLGYRKCQVISRCKGELKQLNFQRNGKVKPAIPMSKGRSKCLDLQFHKQDNSELE